MSDWVFSEGSEFDQAKYRAYRSLDPVTVQQTDSEKADSAYYEQMLGLFMTEAFCVTDQDGLIQEANVGLEELLGFTSKYLKGKPLLMLVAPEERAQYSVSFAGLPHLEHPGGRWLLQLRTAHDEALPVAARVRCVYDEQGRIRQVYWLIQDLRPEVVAMLPMQRLLTPASAVQLQEQERRRIAAELHDDIGQLLTGLRLDLAGANGRHATDTLDLVDQVIERVRDLSMALHPSVLDQLGLLPALQAHFAHYTRQTRVAVRFEHLGLEQRFLPDLELAVYRIIQEALTNVARYAQVRQVDVHAESDGDKLRLWIEDEGIGFDRTAQTLRPTKGLYGMVQRAALLGGALEVNSSVGKGTIVCGEFPLNPDSALKGKES